MIALIGEAWGENEAQLRRPFVGASGVELLRMLEDAGALRLSRYDEAMIEAYWRERDPKYTALVWDAHPEFFLTNVFNLRPEGNRIENLCGDRSTKLDGYGPLTKGKFVRSEFTKELVRLKGELAERKPNIAVALGNTAAWALLHNSGITRIRGTVAGGQGHFAGLKVLPTFHPAAVLRQYENRHVTVLDLQKAARESAYPEVRRPERTVYIDPSLEDLAWFDGEHLRGAVRIACDIETAAGEITCIGFAPSRAVAVVVPFVDPRSSSRNYWRTAREERFAWEWVRGVLNLPQPKIFQNGLYDIHFLWRKYGLTVANASEDTMLLHHALQPESKKGLGFLGSVYTNEASWKIMRDKSQTLKRDE